MRQQPARPARYSRQDPVSPPRHTGTVPRGDPRRKTPSPSPRNSWMFGVLGLVIGAFVIGGIVVGGSSANVATATGAVQASVSGGLVAAATATPGSTAERATQPATALQPTAIPELTFGPTVEPPPSTPQPTPIPTSTSTPAATPGPTVAPPTPEPTVDLPTPSPMRGLAFDFPRDGEVLSDADINVIGRAQPEAEVTRDIPMWFDDHTTTRDDGIWMMPIHLGQGENVLRFRVGDDRSTEQVLTVTYQP